VRAERFACSARPDDHLPRPKLEPRGTEVGAREGARSGADMLPPKLRPPPDEKLEPRGGAERAGAENERGTLGGGLAMRLGERPALPRPLSKRRGAGARLGLLNEFPLGEDMRAPAEP
jgi:hypothetical protein